MTLEIERIPTLGDNYTYLLVCTETGEAAVVDAPEAEPVFAAVERRGCRVTRILSTHHHPDHSAANPALGRIAGLREGIRSDDRDSKRAECGRGSLHGARVA